MSCDRPVPVRSLAGVLLALCAAAAWAAGSDTAPAGTAVQTDPPAVATPSADQTAAGAPAASSPEPISPPSTATPAPGNAASSPASAEVTPAQPPVATPAPARRAETLRTESARPDARRPSLLPLAQPLWSELTAVQRQVLAPFAEGWNVLPVTEKRAWADLALRFPAMKADEQKRVEKRIAEWAALTPEQRRIARANFVLAQQVARENLLAQWENYQSMTPEQRSVLGTVGNTGSNTAARHVTGATGLAAVAAQPLPRRAAKAPSIAVGTDGQPTSSGGVTPTVGTAGTAGKR